MRLTSRAPNYIRRFGLNAGLRLLAQVEHNAAQRPERLMRLTVPGFAAPIWLRDSVADRATFWQCIASAQYEFGIFPQHSRLMQRYQAAVDAQRPPLIIDCGANIGLAAVWFANKLPHARVVCIEPDAQNLAVLQRNIEPYGDRITTLHGGIWPRAAHLRISNPEGGAAAFRVEEDLPRSGALRAYTIDEVCAVAGEQRPLIVKIDIEGAQAALFSDNTEWVQRSDLIVLELDDWQMPWQGTSRNFFRCLAQHPFDYLMHGESIFCFRDTGNEI
jgi:FkbM family methyltransferase